MFVPPICRSRWRKNFSVLPDPTNRRQPSELRSERSDQSNTARSAASPCLGHGQHPCGASGVYLGSIEPSGQRVDVG